jgi:hypothetical protein
MIASFTHRASGHGDCLDCGTEIPDTISDKLVRNQELIGKIESDITGFVVYRVGIHDCNKRCNEFETQEDM